MTILRQSSNAPKFNNGTKRICPRLYDALFCPWMTKQILNISKNKGYRYPKRRLDTENILVTFQKAAQPTCFSDESTRQEILLA